MNLGAWEEKEGEHRPAAPMGGLSQTKRDNMLQPLLTLSLPSAVFALLLCRVERRPFGRLATTLDRVGPQVWVSLWLLGNTAWLALR